MIFLKDLYGTGRTYVINTDLERTEFVNTNYKGKGRRETNPGKSYELLLHDHTHFGTSIKLMICLL